MKSKKRICCIAMALTFISSIVITPSYKVSANANNHRIMTEATNIDNSGLQADLVFPDYLNYVDDTLIVNNMYTFKGYKGQGLANNRGKLIGEVIEILF